MIQFRRIVSPITIIENIAISAALESLSVFVAFMAEGVGARLRAQPTLN
jgi:hypothetical protein